MTSRIVAAAIMATLLLGLILWQNHRWNLVSACHNNGGVWDGQSSKCRLVPARIFIGRELQRT
jgi:hypothetical protein